MCNLRKDILLIYCRTTLAEFSNIGGGRRNFGFSLVSRKESSDRKMEKILVMEDVDDE